MARDRITGWVLREDVFEWTTVSARVGGKVESANRVLLARPAETDGEEQGAEGAPDRTAILKPEWARFKGSVAVAGLPTDQLLLRVLELPAVESDELAGMVSLQVDKFSPFPVEKMVVSHEVLQRRDTASLVLVAAVKRDVIDALGETLRQVDAVVDRIDAAILGWWQILLDGGKIGTAGRQAFLFLDGPAPELIVAQDGIPILFRAVAGPAGLTEEQAAAEVAAEVAHSLMSLELEHGGGAATTLYVWRRAESPQGVTAALAAECDCSVEEQELEALPRVSEGLARRAAGRADGARLDLTPASWRDVEQAQSFRKTLIIFSAAALAVWALAVGGLLGGLAFEGSRLQSLKDAYEAGRGPALEVADMRRRVFTIERYMDVRTSALECLREVSSVQPQGIDLNAFTYRKSESLSIGGESDGVNRVYEFKNLLDEGGLFVESSLIGPRRDPSRRKDVFEIVLKLPGGAE